MDSKKKARTPKYGFFSCVKYSMALTWKTKKSVAISAIGIIPVTLILSAIGLYMPSIILNRLETEDLFIHITAVIAGIIFSQMIFSLIRQYMDVKRADAEHFVLMQMSYDMNVRSRDMDYFLRLEEENVNIMERASKVTENNHTAGIHFVEYFANMIINVLSFCLFGTVVMVFHPLVFALLVLGYLANFFLAKWQKRKTWEIRDDANIVSKKLNYLAWNISNNLQFGKDIRLFGFGDFLDKRIAQLESKWYQEKDKAEKYGIFTAIVNFLVVLVRDGIAYILLIHQAVTGEVDGAQFVLYFSAIAQLSGFLSGILNTWTSIYEGALSVSDYREFFDIKDRLKRQGGRALPPGKGLDIEFRNVTYKYPKGEKNVLENVSFKIEAGEKVALVGVNGAGKTTMTLLMCGLLVPDEGEVFIDGHSIYEYNRDELYSHFSLVPQDYSLLPASIAENISLVDTEAGEQIDMEKLRKCIEDAGFAEKINQLPQGVNTPLNRQVNPDATDLSGGEIQKLLLARAMYRNADILILDEPTAALDPVAEDYMYQKYNQISADSTSVFISHRLASTRFCDRIFLIDGSSVAEVGTHDELMEKGGKYRELFEVQAKYYKEDAEDEGIR